MGPQILSDGPKIAISDRLSRSLNSAFDRRELTLASRSRMPLMRLATFTPKIAEPLRLDWVLARRPDGGVRCSSKLSAASEDGRDRMSCVVPSDVGNRITPNLALRLSPHHHPTEGNDESASIHFGARVS
jgi:hypothetical protein